MLRHRLTTHLTLALLCTTVLLAACTNRDPYTREEEVSNTTIGAGIGAAGGAIAGGLIGGGDWRKRALLGAGIGAVAGGGVGYYMDQQEAALRERLERTGVSVTRVGDSIRLNMPGNITFGVDKSNIQPSFHDVLDSVALVLEEYEKTYVDVLGHTDSTGAAAYNQQLSEERAASVAKYLMQRGILRQRLLVRGLGETQPIATNDTAEGRQQNRRVTIQITPVTN